MRCRIRILVCCLVSLSLAAWQSASAQDQPTIEPDQTAIKCFVIQVHHPANDNAARVHAKIRRALDEPTSLEFVETPLTDVVDYLKDLHKIEIQIDSKALEDTGAGTDTPVTKNLRGISLDSALRLVLGPMELVHLIEGDVLLITTEEGASRSVSLRAYDCDWAKDRIPTLIEALSLAKPLGLPKNKDAAAVANQFKIWPMGSVIAVRASALQHDTIERLLIDLRSIDHKRAIETETEKP